MPCFERNTPDPREADHAKRLRVACPNTTEGVSARGSMCPLRGSCAAGLVLRVFQSCATAGAVRVVPAGRLRDVRGGIDRDEGSSSPRGAKSQPYAGTVAHEPLCFAANGVDVESIEAGGVKHHATVSEGPGSANCSGSRAPPTVTVLRRKHWKPVVPFSQL
jgi:hypothetical protein